MFGAFCASATGDEDAAQAFEAFEALRTVLARLDQVELTGFERRMAAEQVLRRAIAGKPGSDGIRRAVGGSRVVASR